MCVWREVGEGRALFFEGERERLASGREKKQGKTKSLRRGGRGNDARDRMAKSDDAFFCSLSIIFFRAFSLSFALSFASPRTISDPHIVKRKKAKATLNSRWPRQEAQKTTPPGHRSSCRWGPPRRCLPGRPRGPGHRPRRRRRARAGEPAARRPRGRTGREAGAWFWCFFFLFLPFVRSSSRFSECARRKLFFHPLSLLTFLSFSLSLTLLCQRRESQTPTPPKDSRLDDSDARARSGPPGRCSRHGRPRPRQRALRVQQPAAPPQLRRREQGRRERRERRKQWQQLGGSGGDHVGVDLFAGDDNLAPQLVALRHPHFLALQLREAVV